MTCSDIRACAIDKWYQTFQNDTFESKFVQIEKQVLKYLHTDGILIPDERSMSSSKNKELRSFLNSVTIEIENLGGTVIPKFTWSVPCDAVWMRKTLKCNSAIEVIMLLKSSNQITHDLDHAFDECSNCPQDIEQSSTQNNTQIPLHNNATEASFNFKDHSLCLRKWQDVDEGKEFRCFVKSQNLIAISQRHPNHFFPSLPDKLDDYRISISNFFEIKIKYKFWCSDYIFDVYIDKKRGTVLVDFNPYNLSTKSLLFTFEELESLYHENIKKNRVSRKMKRSKSAWKTKSTNQMSPQNTQSYSPPIFSHPGPTTIYSHPSPPSITSPISASIPVQYIQIRCIHNQAEVRPSPFGWDAYPEDMLHITKGLDPQKMDDLLKMATQKRDDDDETKDDEDYDDDDDKYEG